MNTSEFNDDSFWGYKQQHQRQNALITYTVVVSLSFDVSLMLHYVNFTLYYIKTMALLKHSVFGPLGFGVIAFHFIWWMYKWKYSNQNEKETFILRSFFYLNVYFCKIHGLYPTHDKSFDVKLILTANKDVVGRVCTSSNYYNKPCVTWEVSVEMRSTLTKLQMVL